jgi:hypothetical protein
MGRKKRKLVEIDPSTDDAEKEADVSETEAIPQEPSPAAKFPVAVVEPEITSALIVLKSLERTFTCRMAVVVKMNKARLPRFYWPVRAWD